MRSVIEKKPHLMDIILGLDVGTSKLCLTAVDILTGRVVKTVSAKNNSDLPNDDSLIKEQSPEIILRQVVGLFKTLTGCLGKKKWE